MASSFHHPAAPARAYSVLLAEEQAGTEPWAELGRFAGGCSGRAGSLRADRNALRWG
jgi:hypothetical protein